MFDVDASDVRWSLLLLSLLLLSLLSLLFLQRRFRGRRLCKGLIPRPASAAKAASATPPQYIRLRWHCETFVHPKLDLVARVPDAEP